MLLENEDLSNEQVKKETSPTDLSAATEDELKALVSTVNKTFVANKMWAVKFSIFICSHGNDCCIRVYHQCLSLLYCREVI